MRQSRIGWIGVVSVSLLACSKTESASAPAGSASAASTSAPAAEAANSSSEAPAAAAPVPEAPPPAPAPSGAPASFKGGTKENIAGAVGLGCEATSLDGYLQLLCRKKTGTGGHPVSATIVDLNAPPADPPSEQEPGGEPAEGDAGGNVTGINEQGELVLVVPFSGDTRQDVQIEWTDTRYTLHVVGNKATLEWAASGIPHRRACQQVLDESKAVVKAAQNAEGEARLTMTEGQKYGRFGVCQPGGLGSWAVALKSLAGKGEGALRQHHVELEVIRVDIDGKRKSAPFGSLDVAPGGFEIAALQVYDYDDDGRDELIVPYEVKAAGVAPATWPSPIWSFSDAGITAYAKAPAVGGGIGIEQLDFDMRPDFGTYAGYVAYLGADCGLKTCPPRLTGPKLFWHSQPDGSFSDRDDASKSALKRASCQSKPSAVVVEAGGSVNAAQTAKNVVCSRAFGVPADAVIAELTAKHAALCGESATCPLETALQTWAKLELPLELTATVAKK